MSPHRREAAPAFSRAAIRLRPGDPAVPPLPGSVPAVRRVGGSCRLSAWCACAGAGSAAWSRSGSCSRGVSKLPCNPSSSTGRATLPEPHPPDADQGGPDRARERRGPRCIRSVRRGPRAGLPARRFGGVPPPSSPCFTPCQVERFGLHAQSSHPPPERVGLHPLRTPAPPAGRTPPPAGPGNAVRPPSRGREGRRPRDGRRTPALATAHPAGLKSGPARRVRLSQIPASRTAKRRAIAAAERPGRRISARSP